ncbi:hypothetical protein EUX98_g1860 [Antrodiella citrinella]|uniref:Transcriptional regulatory protein RXT2 N-terminal domain-containing protein n=1 Tax=Antrodiella citrinella TaxID=2447956 RepID=A0A4S4N8S8_9APHY|nr:hypothetical protein EUX98_g1860 [Antrodiella citrinella]
MFDEARYEDPSFVGLPSNDINSWYYPSHGYNSDADDDDVRYNTSTGNWGKKTHKDARWIRTRKMTAWGPGIEEWETEERARKRLRMIIPPPEDDDTPVALPHLRSPSPPAMSPYPKPASEHTSYTSFIMDKGVTHTYRSNLFDELEQATNGLIEGETVLRRALGRLWQVMNTDPDKDTVGSSIVPKREEAGDGEEDDERDERMARAPDLTPGVHKLFLSSYSERSTPGYDASQFTQPGMALENLEKSIATLRELQDDGREYIERLEDIREGLGFTRSQRDGVWNLVRERALKELQDTAYASAM